MKRESKMEEVKMKSEFLILDSDYLDWVKELSARYRKSQIKAAVKVNQEMLRFYWELGKDIVKLNAENKYGSNFYTVISTDLKRLVPNASGLSPSNIRYAKRFFELYSSTYTNFQQLAEKSETNLSLSEKMLTDLFSVPWGHHMLLIDKCSDNTQKALFFVHQTVENGHDFCIMNSERMRSFS